MKSPLCCYKAAIILTFFLSLTVANAVEITILDVSVNGSTFLPGSSIEVDFEVHYYCAVLGPKGQNFTLSVYASSDTTITDSDLYLGSESYNVTYGSGELSGTITCYLPMDIAQGEYYIGIMSYADSDYDSSPITIEAAQYPDLEFAFVGISDSYEIMPGESGTVDFTVQNIGSFDSGAFYVYIYASEDSTITDDDYEVAHSHPGSLAPGEDIDITKAFYISADFPPGDYYIGGIVDCSYDSDLGNNSYCGDSFTVVSPIDISVEKVSTDSVFCTPGGSVNVTVTTENVEQMSSSEYTIKYYASTNYTTTYFLGSLERFGLDPGEDETFDRLCQFPSDIPQGYYRIGAILDCSDDANPDNDEGWSSPIWVGPCTDLSVESVTVDNLIYQPGDQLTVYTLIKNIGDSASESYSVDYYASSDMNINEQDLCLCSVNRDALGAGKQHSYNTSFNIPKNYPEGTFYIGIIVTCPEESDKSNNVGYCESVMELTYPAGYVCGQMKYQDRLRVLHPIRYSLVEIYEVDHNQDPLDDRVLGQTHTDHNGNYGVVILNEPQVSENIYVRVFTKGFSGAYPGTTSQICQVKDDVLEQLYYLESFRYDPPQNSSLVINLTATGDNNGAFMVYDSIVEGFHKAKTFFNIEMHEITTYWPFSEDISCFIPTIGIFISELDQGDRDVIMHEYGHYIADEYSFTQGDVGEDGRHYWDRDLRYQPVNRTDEQARNLTFREAWATLFSVATQYGDTGYEYIGDEKYQDFDQGSNRVFTVNLEEETSAHDSPGQYYDNMNTCALWDIFDDQSCEEDNLDTLSDTSLSKIWSIMKVHKPDDIIDFWNSWFVLYDYEEELRRIFLDHEMTFIE
jgi:hypothetical protein